MKRTNIFSFLSLLFIIFYSCKPSEQRIEQRNERKLQREQNEELQKSRENNPGFNTNIEINQNKPVPSKAIQKRP